MTHTNKSAREDDFDPERPETVYEAGKYVATLDVVDGVHNGRTIQFLGSDFGSREEVLDAISAPRNSRQTTIAVEFARYDGDTIDTDLDIGNGDGVIIVDEETKEARSLGTGFESARDIERAITHLFYDVSNPNNPHRICIACDTKRPEWAIDEALHLLREEWMEDDQATLGELLTEISEERFSEMDLRHGEPEEVRREHIIEQLTTE